MSIPKDKGRLTSRRDFAKAIGAALAASQVGTTLAQSASTESKAKPALRNERTHDTPPPIVFENSSFVLERRDEFQPNDIGMSPDRTRKEYRVRPSSGSTVVPAHIKILDGSGEIIYRNDNAANCLISIELEKSNVSSMVNAKTSTDKSMFVIDVDPDKLLNLGQANNNDKPTSKKRDRRYRHSSADMNMKEITIKEGNKVLYSLLPRDRDDKGEDLRIMIWLEPA